MSADFDIVIVGGGIAGASLGAELARARRVLIVEAEDAVRLSFDRPVGGLLSRKLWRARSRATDPVASGPFLADGGYLAAARRAPSRPRRMARSSAGRRWRRTARRGRDRGAWCPGFAPNGTTACSSPAAPTSMSPGFMPPFSPRSGAPGATFATASRVIGLPSESGDGWTVSLADGGTITRHDARQCRGRLGRPGGRGLRRRAARLPAQAADDGPAARRADRPQGPAAGRRLARQFLFQGRGRQLRCG